MTWLQFLVFHSTLVIVLLLIWRKLLSSQWENLLRTLMTGTIFVLMADYIAEDRDYWTFPSLLGIEFFSIPLENLIFTVSSLTLAILLYLRASSAVARRKQQPGNPESSTR